MKNFNKIIIICSFLISLILGVCLVRYFKKTKDQDILVVGMMSGWPPFMNINLDGQYEGFDVDVAQEVAKELGKKLEIVDAGSLAPLFISLDQGKIDMILSGLDVTAKRLESLSMIPYTGCDVTSLKLLFWNKIPENIKSIEDFANFPGAIISFEPGSASDNFLKKFDYFEKKSLAQVADMIMDIKYGKSTAAILEPAVANRLQKQNPEIKLLDVKLSKDCSIYGMGIAIKKENKKLFDSVSVIITKLKNNKTLEKLEKKWGVYLEESK